MGLSNGIITNTGEQTHHLVLPLDKELQEVIVVADDEVWGFRGGSLVGGSVVAPGDCVLVRSAYSISAMTGSCRKQCLQ